MPGRPPARTARGIRPATTSRPNPAEAHMKRLLPALLATLAVATPALAYAGAPAVLASETKTYAAKSVNVVHVDFTVGELNIEGTDGDQVVVKLYVHCGRDNDRCEELAGDLRLDARTRGDRMDITVDGRSVFKCDDYWVEGVIQIPARVSLDIEMPVGEVRITDMKSDVDLRLKLGEATIEMREAHVGRVSAGITIGEATIESSRGHEQVEGLFGRRVRWAEGRGSARVDVHVGVGEASIRLL
jgi:hypothetical protein